MTTATQASGRTTGRRFSMRRKIAIVVVSVVLVSAAIALVVQLSGSSDASLAKWVVLPQVGAHGPRVTTAQSEIVTLGDDVVTLSPSSGWASTVSADKTNVSLTGDRLSAYISVQRDTTAPSAIVTRLVTDWVYNDASITTVRPDNNPVNLPVGGDVTAGSRFVYTARSISSGDTLVGNLFAYARNDGWAMEIQLVASGTDASDAGKRLTGSTDVSTLLTDAYKSFAHT